MPATAVTRRRSDNGTKRTVRTRVGLALAGGGPLGGIYEVGALIALADSLDGIDFNDLDVYVGVSSGGFVAAALANGISPAQMYRLFIDDGAEAALSPGLFSASGLRRIRAPRGVAAAIAAPLYRSTTCRHPFQRSCLESMATLGRAVPTGVFDQRAIDAFLTRLLAGPGRTNDFRKLSRKLFLVATNLDTGASVTFGMPGWDHVPITQGDRSLRRVARPLPAGRNRRRALRRRRAEQDAARVGRPRRGRDDAHLHQPAGSLRREFSIAAQPPYGRETQPRRIAAGARANFSRHHSLAHESRHGEDTADNIRTRTSCCSNPIARMPTCSSRTSSATRIASGCARRRTARPGKACWRGAQRSSRNWRNAECA